MIKIGVENLFSRANQHKFKAAQISARLHVGRPASQSAGQTDKHEHGQADKRASIGQQADGRPAGRANGSRAASRPLSGDSIRRPDSQTGGRTHQIGNWMSASIWTSWGFACARSPWPPGERNPFAGATIYHARPRVYVLSLHMRPSASQLTRQVVGWLAEQLGRPGGRRLGEALGADASVPAADGSPARRPKALCWSICSCVVGSGGADTSEPA